MNPNRFPLMTVNKDDPKFIPKGDLRKDNLRFSLTNFLVTGSALVPNSGPWTRNGSTKAAKKPEVSAEPSRKETGKELLQDFVRFLETEPDGELKIKKKTHRSEGGEKNKVSASITYSPQDFNSDKNKKAPSVKSDNKSRKGSVSFDDYLPAWGALDTSSVDGGDKQKAQGKKGKGKDKGKGPASPDPAPANPSGHAASGGKEWTPSEDAMILSMKKGGETWANIGLAVSHSKGEVQKRYKELMAKKGDTAKDATTSAVKDDDFLATVFADEVAHFDALPKSGQSHKNHRPPPDQSKNNHRPPPEQSNNKHRAPPEQSNDKHRAPPESWQGFPPPESFQGFPPPVNHHSSRRDYYPPGPYNYPPGPYNYPSSPPRASYSYPYGPAPYGPGPSVYRDHGSMYHPPQYGNRHHYTENIVHNSPRPSTRASGGGPDITWYNLDGPAVTEMDIKGVHNTWIRCSTGDRVVINDKAVNEPPNGWRNDRHKDDRYPGGKRNEIRVNCNSGEAVWVMASRLDEPTRGWGQGGRGYRIVDGRGESTGDSTRPANEDRNVRSPNGDWAGGNKNVASVHGGSGGGSFKAASVHENWGGGSFKAASFHQSWGGGSNKTASAKGGWGSNSHKSGSPAAGEWGADNSGGGGSGANQGDWGGNNNGGSGSGGTGDNWGENTNTGNKNSPTNVDNGPAQNDWGESAKNGGGNFGTTGGDWGKNTDNGNSATNVDNGPANDDWGDKKNPAHGNANVNGKYTQSEKRGQKSGTGKGPYRNRKNRANWKVDLDKDDDNTSQASWEKPYIIAGGSGPSNDTGNQKNQNWRGVNGTNKPKHDQDWGNTDKKSGNNGGATDWDDPGPSQKPMGGVDSAW